jgi:hypothetical protein
MGHNNYGKDTILIRKPAQRPELNSFCRPWGEMVVSNKSRVKWDQ